MSLKFWKDRAPKRPHRPWPIGPQQPTNRPIPPVVTPPPVAVVEPLHVDGLHLALPDGSPWFGLGITAFPLLKYWIEDRPKAVLFLDYCQQNGLFPRVLGMYDGWLGRFVPSDYPEYQLHLSNLAAECDRRGLRLLFTCCADWIKDAYRNGALLAIDLVQFVLQCAETLRPFARLALLSAANEIDHNGMAWRHEDGRWGGWLVNFIRPDGLLCSNGSCGMNTTPPPNPWDFAEQHGRRDKERMIGQKDIHNYQRGIECEYVVPASMGDSEPFSIGDTTIQEEKPAVTDPATVYEAVACPFGSFYVLHYRGGLRTLEVPGPVADACIQAGRQAARDVPARFRDGGVYVRGHLGVGHGGFGLVDSPQPTRENPYDNGSIGETFPDRFVRAYGRWVGDEQRIVLARHTDETNRYANQPFPNGDPPINVSLASWLQPMPGWSIVSTHGLTPERPSVVVLRML